MDGTSKLYAFYVKLVIIWSNEIQKTKVKLIKQYSEYLLYARVNLERAVS